MTRVLLIADTERVQRIFQAMAEQGTLQLQTASTLPLGEFELTTSSPDFTFVQSRISGFSGDILLRHLEKMVPPGGKLVLLAGDGEDADRARKQGRMFVELSMEDALLEQSVAALLSAGAHPASAPLEPVERSKKAPRAKKSAAPAAAREEETVPAEPERAATAGETTREEPAVEENPAATPFEPTPLSHDLPQEYPAAARDTGKPVASPFEAVMRDAESRVSPIEDSMLQVEDRVEVGRREAGQTAAREPAGTHPSLADDAAAAGGYHVAETVAEALQKAQQAKRRRPYLFVVPILLVIAVPLVSYLAGKTSAPPEPAAPKPAVKRAPQTVPPRPAQIAPAPAAPKAVPPAPPIKGMAILPPMLEGTTLDAAYGKKNPGWVRYFGLHAEYRLFKEKDLYRAIQVIPVSGGSISDDLFKKVLRQFGGVDAYRVRSTERKGEYLVEQCTTSGEAALTIYRNGNSKKIKALVVYYR